MAHETYEPQADYTFDELWTDSPAPIRELVPGRSAGAEAGDSDDDDDDRDFGAALARAGVDVVRLAWSLVR